MRQDIRDRLRKARQALGPDERSREQAAVVARLIGLPELQAPSSVMAYLATQGELDVEPFVVHLRNSGAVVGLPRVVGEDLSFYEWRWGQELQEGRFGIRTPGPEALHIDRPRVILVPGIAFDRNGHRLGFGSGYYDRYLARHPDALRIGVCFRVQLVPSLPTQPNDQRLDLIVTPDEVLRFRPRTPVTG